MKSHRCLFLLHSGFTLLELLTVVAVIAIIAGVYASSLRPGGPTVALQGAQAQIASLASQARVAAIVRGTNARLIVNNNPNNPDHYLRLVGLVYEDPEQAGLWHPANRGVTLPQGTFVVPSNPMTVPGAGGWPSARTSSMDEMSGLTYMSSAPEAYLYVEWNNRGAVTGNGRLALATAVRGGIDGAEVLFTNPENVRGLVVRRYGTFVLLNEADGFGH